MPEVIKAAEIAGELSHDDIRQMLSRAVEGAGYGSWIVDISASHCVVARTGADRKTTHTRYPYTIEGDGAKLGEGVEVKLSWDDQPATVQATDPDIGVMFSDDGSRTFFVTELDEQFAEPDTHGKARRWVQICRDGTWNHPRFGRVQVDQAFREALVKNFQANVRKTEIPTDYDHAPQGPASGWYRALENRGNTLFAEIEFTPSAVSKVKAGEYRYFSPEWDRNYSDNETGKAHGPTLLGGGLVNRPFFRGMQPLQFADTTGAVPQKEQEMAEIEKGQEAPAVAAAQFAEMERRMKAQDEQLASFRAAEERRGLEQTFGEMTFGDTPGVGGRRNLTPASRKALVDALLPVGAEARTAVIDAVKNLQFVEFGERGFTAGEKSPSEISDAEVKELAALTAAGQVATAK